MALFTVTGQTTKRDGKLKKCQRTGSMNILAL